MGLFGKSKKEKEEKKEDARRGSAASCMSGSGVTASPSSAASMSPKEGKPPGGFGWFGGTSDSVKLSNDPAGFARKHREKHGPVSCAKIASFPSVFSGAYSEAREMFEDVDAFPPHRGLLRLIDKAVGTPFLLDERPGGDQQARAAVIAALNTASPAAANRLDCKPGAPPGFAPTLHPRVSSVLEKAVRKHVTACVGAEKGVADLYKSFKVLGNDVVVQLVLGMPLSDAATRFTFPDLQTKQFRGCESAPVFTPLMTSAYEAGTQAREQLRDVCRAVLFPSGNPYEAGRVVDVAEHPGGPLAQGMLAYLQTSAGQEQYAQLTRDNDAHAGCPFMRGEAAAPAAAAAAAAAPAGRPSADYLTDIFTYLLHGMMPKALGSALLYLWLELAARDDAFWKRFAGGAAPRHVDPTEAAPAAPAAPAVNEPFVQACVLEALRIHPPLGIMGRGVACPMFRGYILNSEKHGEWVSFLGIEGANHDPAAYPNPLAFDPSRWASTPPAAGAPPPPLMTFGAGVRSCPGATLVLELLCASVRSLVALGQRPVLDAAPDAPFKTRPVKKPKEAVKCSFRAVAYAPSPAA